MRFNVIDGAIREMVESSTDSEVEIILTALERGLEESNYEARAAADFLVAMVKFVSFVVTKTEQSVRESGVNITNDQAYLVRFAVVSMIIMDLLGESPDLGTTESTQLFVSPITRPGVYH